VDNLHTRSIAAVGDLFPRVTAREAKRGIAPIELTASLHDFLRDEVRQDIVYVFDDAHHLQSARAAETWLSTFVMGAPSNCHIILISRTIPDLPMAEWIAKREIQRLNQAALRFTPDEIETLVAHLLADTPLRAELPPLLERLEGWAAGLVLALQPVAVDFSEDTLTDKVSVVSTSESLFDSLARTMIDAQPPQMRDFLLHLSIIAKM